MSAASAAAPVSKKAKKAAAAELMGAIAKVELGRS